MCLFGQLFESLATTKLLTSLSAQCGLVAEGLGD